MRSLGPVVLEGASVRLEPLRARHRDGLRAIASGPGLWDWMPADLSLPGAVEAFIGEALAAEDRGAEYAFAVVDQASGAVLGSTRYLDVAAAHRGAEIGWTWYAPAVWGTAVNPEAKLLLLTHAFEAWGAIRICLKTDHRNLHSQAAIRKLGAQHEGTLRSHRIRRDGTFRDTVMFSIVDREWPAVRSALQARLQALRAAEPGQG